MARIPVQISKFIPKKDRFIGLDIGSCSIKLAEFARQQGKLVPLKLKLQEIDSREDNQDSQLDALKILFRDIKTKDAKINVVINCSQSCTKIPVIPFMPKSEILQALKWEMRNYMSFPIDQAVMDYEILEGIAEMQVVETERNGQGACLTLLRDITKRKKAEEKTRKANEKLKEYYQLKDEFVSTASHELRTPLSIILSAIRLCMSSATMRL